VFHSNVSYVMVIAVYFAPMIGDYVWLTPMSAMP